MWPVSHPLLCIPEELKLGWGRAALSGPLLPMLSQSPFFSFFFIFYLFIYLSGCAGSLLRHAGSLLPRARSLLWRAGSFSCGMRTLSCSMWDLVPQPRVKPGPPALGGRSLSHWTTREVPQSPFYHPQFELHLSPFTERGSVHSSPPRGDLQCPHSDLRCPG